MTADARTEIRIFLEEQLGKGDVLLDLDPGDGAQALAVARRRDGPIAVLVGHLPAAQLLALQDQAVEQNTWVEGVPLHPDRLLTVVQHKLRPGGRVVALVRSTEAAPLLERLAPLVLAGRVLALAISDAASAAARGFWMSTEAALQLAGFAPFEVLEHDGAPELFALAGAPAGAVIALHQSVTGAEALARDAQPQATPAHGVVVSTHEAQDPRGPRLVRERGVSFCIITDGRRPALLRDTIASIQRLALPVMEILVSGEPPTDLASDITGVRLIDAASAARTGRLGAMRNAACRAARFDRLVVCDDDMQFHADFATAVDDLDSTDVLCVRLLNPDGSRYWDWATHGGPRGHTLLAYHETDPFVYVTGGLAIMHAWVHATVPWHDDLGFYAGEDLDWSARLRAAGVRIRFSARGTVTHCDARYTQVGQGIGFLQDLTLRERVAHGVDGTGFFRPTRTGGPRWMSRRGALHVTATTSGQQLDVAFGTAPGVYNEQPVTVTVRLNGAPAGDFRLAADQSCQFAVPLSPGVPTTLTLEADRGTDARQLGVPDTREASVALLFAGLRDSTS